jgi:hypothetical protein
VRSVKWATVQDHASPSARLARSWTAPPESAPAPLPAVQAEVAEELATRAAEAEAARALAAENAVTKEGREALAAKEAEEAAVRAAKSAAAAAFEEGEAREKAAVAKAATKRAWAVAAGKAARVATAVAAATKAAEDVAAARDQAEWEVATQLAEAAQRELAAAEGAESEAREIAAARAAKEQAERAAELEARRRREAEADAAKLSAIAAERASAAEAEAARVRKEMEEAARRAMAAAEKAHIEAEIRSADERVSRAAAKAAEEAAAKATAVGAAALRAADEAERKLRNEEVAREAVEGKLHDVSRELNEARAELRQRDGEMARLFADLASEQQSALTRQSDAQMKAAQQAAVRGKLAVAQREISQLKQMVRAHQVANNVQQIDIKRMHLLHVQKLRDQLQLGGGVTKSASVPSLPSLVDNPPAESEKEAPDFGTTFPLTACHQSGTGVSSSAASSFSSPLLAHRRTRAMGQAIPSACSSLGASTADKSGAANRLTRKTKSGGAASSPKGNSASPGVWQRARTLAGSSSSPSLPTIANNARNVSVSPSTPPSMATPPARGGAGPKARLIPGGGRRRTALQRVPSPRDWSV